MRDNDIKIDNKFHYNFNYLNNPRLFNDLLLFQLGEIYCDNGASVKSHVHDDFFEITYVISGKGTSYAGIVPTEISKHDIFLSLPNETHEIVSDQADPLRYYFLAFSFKERSQFHEIMYQDKLLKLGARLRVYNSPPMAASFTELISQLESYNEYSALKFELLVKVLCINVTQVFSNIHTQHYTSPLIDSEQTLYYRVINYIDHNLTKIDRLSDIAGELNYNYVYISRVFKKKFGKSIYTYFSDKKLDIAKQLIETSNMTITEIASYLNYSSIFVFSRVFKNKFGINPSTYRSQKVKK